MTSRQFERQENQAELAAEYQQKRSPAVRTLLRSALGTDKANGYTTAEQADDLLRLLALSPGDRLLDLGAGHGWPGVHLAGASHCRLVSTDLTHEAVAAARHHVDASCLSASAPALAADGIALPFRTGVFNAVVHADVLC